MSKSKKKSQHTYTEEQNNWIMEHPHLQRSELAKKFNKKFDADITPVAIAKRKQRMGQESVVKKGTKGVKRSTFEISGKAFSLKEVLGLIREQGQLIEKLIEKM